MDIIFETSGAIAPFKQWLEAFKEIDDSLLIEIDLEEDMFVAKSFTPDKTIVKYGKISFEQAGMSVINMLDDNGNSMSVSEWLVNNKGRVYVGFLHTLGKFIKTVGIYSSANDDKDKGGAFKFIVRFSPADGRFQANKVEFKSKKLNMVSLCFKLSEFNMKMSDDAVFFNVVAAVPNPISFEIPGDANKLLINVSDIYSSEPKKDIISFEVSDEEGVVGLYARELNKDSYSFCMSDIVKDGAVEDACGAKSPVTRANYIVGIKGDNTAGCSIITISKNSTQNGRMKVETSDGMFTTIIANVRV